MSPRPPLYELDRPLTGDDLRSYSAALALLQGNILKGHGRRAASHVFLTFRDGHRAAAKGFLGSFANRLTSAASQMQQAAARNIDSGALFVSLALTVRGFRFLTSHGAPPAPAPLPADFSDAFRGGMRSANQRIRGEEMKDPAVDTWDAAFQRDIHVLIVLAHESPQVLAVEEGLLLAQVAPFADTFVEHGQNLSRNGHSIEHFGYVDAVSQPIFFEADLPPSTTHWDPSAGPRLVLVRDPLATSDEECGSYLVFRKLKQDVAAFRRARHALATALSFTHGDPDKRAGALIVGRFEDGTPRATSSGSLGASAVDNDFNYANDRAGLTGCPLDAHIRIMNPRSKEARKHRIARRGMAYGDRTPDGQDTVAWEQGLLFQCYQRDLVGQFEYLQAATRFAQMDRMLRPHSRAHKPGMSRPVAFDNLVTLRGGEYFYVPAISGLRRLASA